MPNLPDIFAIEDTAVVNAWKGRPVPGLEPAAKQKGRYVASVIRTRIGARRAPAPFPYRHLNSLATIGRKATVTDFSYFRVSDAPAWWLWGLVHIDFLAGMRNHVSIVSDWLWAYRTFRGSTRLIAGPRENSNPSPIAASVIPIAPRIRHG